MGLLRQSFRYRSAPSSQRHRHSSFAILKFSNKKNNPAFFVLQKSQDYPFYYLRLFLRAANNSFDPSQQPLTDCRLSVFISIKVYAH